MGKTIYCLSNGSPVDFPDNTLTIFGNKLPFFYDFHNLTNHKIHICLEAIGFSTNFKRVFLPPVQYLPCFILMVKKPKEVDENGKPVFQLPESRISTFKNDSSKQDYKVLLDTVVGPIIDKLRGSDYNYAYLDEDDLTSEKLKAFLKRLSETENIEIEIIEASNCVLVKAKEPTVLFVYLPLLKYLEINQIPTGTGGTAYNNTTRRKFVIRYIAGEKYRRFKFSSNTGMLEFKLNILQKPKLPKIIKIKCDNIKDQIYDNQKSKDLMVFCPEIGSSHKFFYHEFESKTYCVLENTLFNTVKFQILDENDDHLDLDIGIPTILKLDLQAMEKYKKSFNVRVTSEIQTNHESNSNNKFKTTLPQTLYLNENWKVALSSVNLPNVFNTFITNNQVVGILIGDGMNRRKIEYKLHNRSFTKNDLLGEINNFLKVNALEMEIGEITEEKGADYQIKANIKLNQGILVLTRELAEILGFTSVTFRNEKTYFVSRVNEVPTIFQANRPIDIDLHKPTYFMLYSKLVQPTAVSGNFMNVLKIFPVAQTDQKYVIQEFKHREYLGLNNSDIKEIEFELRSHAGDLIQFCSKTTDVVILNLHFTNYI